VVYRNALVPEAVLGLAVAGLVRRPVGLPASQRLFQRRSARYRARSARRAERWFNVDAGFNRSTLQQLANNIQTLSNRFSGVRADGINNFDLSLFKNLRIKEKVTAQVRIENFNALNHVQFAAPNVNPLNAAFGSITGEKGHGQRQITFGLKFVLLARPRF
jgi:hypothetical protein